MKKTCKSIALLTATLIAAAAYQPANAFTRTAPAAFQQSDGIVLQVRKHKKRRGKGKRRGGNGAALGAGIALGILGAAIATDNRRRYYDDDDDVVYERPRRRRGGSWARHVERCYNAYRSYNERTDTYVSYSGERRRCRK